MIRIVNTTEEHYDFLKSYFKKFVTDLDKFLNTKNYRCCEYRVDGKLIGCVFFVIHDTYIHINASLVSENFRGIGINREMGEKIIEYYMEIPNINKLTCNIGEKNKSSVQSALKIGFEINNNVDMYYPDGEKKIAMYYKLK